MHKRETGEMSGNAPIAVNQAVQKRVKNGGPSETLRTSLAPQGAPGSGRRLGAASMRAAEEQSPQITGESGAVKTVGVPQGGTKSEPATQVTGKGRLGGEKKEGVEKDDQGHQNRERKEDLGVPEKGDPGVKEPVRKSRGGAGEGHRKNRIPRRPNSRSEEDAAEREEGTEKRTPGRQNSRSEKTWRSGRGAPATGDLGDKIAGQKETWRSGREAPETGYLGVKIAGQKKTWLSGRWAVKRANL